MATTDVTEWKRQAAYRAVAFVQSGMIIGLGGGTTAAFGVKRIAQLLRSGELSHIAAIPCSKLVAEQAHSLGVPLTTFEHHSVIDITFDGADEVDPQWNLIKGGGGALLGEKILAQASRREIIIVDETKISPRLGTKWAVPVEVLPFGSPSQTGYLSELGARPVMRTNPDGSPFTTDQGNLILDCHFGPIQNPNQLARDLERRAGIVCHGLFLDLATDLIVAGSTGVVHRSR